MQVSVLVAGIGAVAGVGAYILLSLATRAILRGDAARAALPMLGNIAVLFFALLGTAVLAKAYIIWMGAGLAAGLILSAVMRLLVNLRKGKNGDGKGKGEQ